MLFDGIQQPFPFGIDGQIRIERQAGTMGQPCPANRLGSVQALAKRFTALKKIPGIFLSFSGRFLDAADLTTGVDTVARQHFVQLPGEAIDMLRY
jgi:hypothetical protein